MKERERAREREKKKKKKKREKEREGIRKRCMAVPNTDRVEVRGQRRTYATKQVSNVVCVEQHGPVFVPSFRPSFPLLLLVGRVGHACPSN